MRTGFWLSRRYWPSGTLSEHWLRSGLMGEDYLQLAEPPAVTHTARHILLNVALAHYRKDESWLTNYRVFSLH